MDPGLYIAASGMLAEQVRQNQLSNDLANSSTPGYKTEQANQRSFGALLLSNTATGQPVGTIDTGVTVDRMVLDTTPAALRQTGQPLDFGIAGQGFFAVRTGQGVQYTRDGQFSSNASGLLTDAQGNLVLSQGGAPIRVGARGTVPANSLGVFNVTNPSEQGNNLFSGRAAGRASGTVQQGALEQSGVDPVNTMVDMIASMRAYESGQKAISSIDDTMQADATQVGSLNGG